MYEWMDGWIQVLDERKKKIDSTVSLKHPTSFKTVKLYSLYIYRYKSILHTSNAYIYFFFSFSFSRITVPPTMHHRQLHNTANYTSSPTMHHRQLYITANYTSPPNRQLCIIANYTSPPNRQLCIIANYTSPPTMHHRQQHITANYASSPTMHHRQYMPLKNSIIFPEFSRDPNIIPSSYRHPVEHSFVRVRPV